MSAMPARSRSSRMAVAKRGSAKIITPAADCMRWAQVREPTTRKNASWILRCSQTMPVRPQNTSRWPRSLIDSRRRAGRGARRRRGVAFTTTPPQSRSERRRLQPRRAQLQHELGGVDDVGGVGGQRDRHLSARASSRADDQRGEIGGVQRQHQHAERVFPEEGGGEQVAAEHHLLPDRAGDHDCVKRERLYDDRDCRGFLTTPVSRKRSDQRQARPGRPGTAPGRARPGPVSIALRPAAPAALRCRAASIAWLPIDLRSCPRSLIGAGRSVRLDADPRSRCEDVSSLN